MPVGTGGDWGVPDPGSAPHAPHTGRVTPGRFSLCPPARSFLPCRHRGGGAARPVPPLPASVKGEALRCSPPSPPRSLSPPSRLRCNSEYRGFHAMHRTRRGSEVWKLHPGSERGKMEGGGGTAPSPLVDSVGSGQWGLQRSLPTWRAKFPL